MVGEMVSQVRSSLLIMPAHHLQTSFHPLHAGQQRLRSENRSDHGLARKFPTHNMDADYIAPSTFLVGLGSSPLQRAPEEESLWQTKPCAF